MMTKTSNMTSNVKYYDSKAPQPAAVGEPNIVVSLLEEVSTAVSLFKKFILLLALGEANINVILWENSTWLRS